MLSLNDNRLITAIMMMSNPSGFIIMMCSAVQPVLTNPFVLYQSTLLSAYTERLIHGFTGKPISLGGQHLSSEQIQDSRRQVCQRFHLNTERLTLPRQTHTDRFRVNDLPCETEADAVIVTEPDVPVMVQVADCVPVILYDPKRHVGAVIHSGWRGTAQSITKKVITSLVEDYGTKAEQVCAVIGPSIGGCCYEVSDEVEMAVSQTIPKIEKSAFSTMQDNGKPRVDLQQVIRHQLLDLNVIHIEVIPACTRCEESHLWSHRRGELGRQVAFLQLLPLKAD